MDPQQELFTKLKLSIEAEGFDVYDGFLPPDGTPYPFVYLGESQLIDDANNKTAVFGFVRQTVHIWHSDPRQRGTVSSMALTIKQTARSIEQTTNFNWHVKGVDQRILPDNTTKQPLLHGVVDIEFYFT